MITARYVGQHEQKPRQLTLACVSEKKGVEMEKKQDSGVDDDDARLHLGHMSGPS